MPMLRRPDGVMPTILLPGTDIPHPPATSDELARLLPGVRLAGRKSWSSNGCG
jgi:hypothetical protein